MLKENVGKLKEEFSCGFKTFMGQWKNKKIQEREAKGIVCCE